MVGILYSDGGINHKGAQAALDLLNDDYPGWTTEDGRTIKDAETLAAELSKGPMAVCLDGKIMVEVLDEEGMRLGRRLADGRHLAETQGRRE